MKDTKKPATPTTRTDIGHLLDQLRDLKVKLAFALANRDKAVQTVAARYADDVTEIEGEILTIEAAVQRWAQDNRATEFKEEKTLTFASGAAVQFRMGQKRFVLLEGVTDADVLVLLQKSEELRKYIRTEQSIDRSGLIADIGSQLPPKIAKRLGIEIRQDESVLVKVPMATAGKEKS